MRIDCSNCDHSFSVADDRRGSTVRCPECEEPIKVPSGKSSERSGKTSPAKSSRSEREGIVERKKTSIAPGKVAKKTSIARDLDDDEEDDRPVRKGKSRRARDDDDDDDRPVRKRPSSRRDDDDDDVEEEKKSGSPLIWILSGVGGVALIGVAVLVIFLMRGSPDQAIAQNPDQAKKAVEDMAKQFPQAPPKMPGAMPPPKMPGMMPPALDKLPAGSFEDALAFLPAKAEFVFGVSLSSPGSSFFKKLMDEQMHNALEKELLQMVDSVIVAQDGRGLPTSIVQLKKPLDKDTLQWVFKGEMADQLKGKTIYRKIGDPQSVLIVVNASTFVECRASNDELGMLMDSKTPSLRADMLAQVRRLHGNTMWAVGALDSKTASFEMKQMAGSMNGMEEVAKILQTAKVGSVFAKSLPDGKSLRVQGAVTVANSGDAGRAATILKQKTKETLDAAGPFLGGPLMADLKTIEFSSSGADVTAAFTLSEAALKQMENPGAFPGPGPSPKLPPNYPPPNQPIATAPPTPPPGPANPIPGLKPNPGTTPGTNPNPGVNPNPAQPAAPKVIFEADGRIESIDAPDQKRPGSFCKYIPLVFEAGKTYTVVLKQAPGSAVDPYLYLLDGTGNMLGFNDNGGGNKDARLVYKATQSGPFVAVASTSGPKQYGAFKIVVSETGQATNPKPNPANPNNPTPATNSKQYTGTQSLKNYNHLEFLFDDCCVTMTNKDGKTQGVYQVQGGSIAISFQQPNRIWNYIGVINGNTITGQASGTAGGKNAWNFTVNLKAPPPNPKPPVNPNPGVNPNPMPPPAGPLKFVGTENLRNPATNLELQFLGNNQVKIIDDKGTATGNCSLQGNKIVMNFNLNGAALVYTAELATNQGWSNFHGHATGGKDAKGKDKHWTFQTKNDKVLTLAAIANPGANPNPPVNPNPPPPPNPGPNPGSLGNVKFSGTETLPGYGNVAFQFQGLNQVVMIDKDGQANGTYVVNGATIVLIFNNRGQIIYTGQIAGQTISGTATNGRDNWSFNVKK